MFKFLVRTFIVSACLLILARGLHLSLGSLPEVSINVDNIAPQLGINHRHEMLRYEDFQGSVVERKTYRYISAQGANVSVVDINEDGFYDLFFPSTLFKGKSYLYVNQKDGSFLEKAKEYGLDRINEDLVTSRAIFFDADNDGEQEMLQLGICPTLYKKNKAGFYERKIIANERLLCQYSVSVNVIDINQDGLLDIVFAPVSGNYGDPDFYLPNNFSQNYTGGQTSLLVNKGNAEFELDRITLARFKQKLFTNAIGVGDFSNTNSQDIWFATDYNNDQVVFKNDSYKNVINLKGSFAKSGMSVEQTFMNDKSYVFISHVYRKYFYPFGNNLWSYENGEFVDYASEFGVTDCEFAWGAKFIDVNQDGYLDLYVSNGLFGNSTSKKDYWYNLSVVASLYQKYIPNSKMWPEMDSYHLSGNNRDCLFINQNNKKFIRANVTGPNQIDAEALNGRSVATIDINNDGNQQIVVVNHLEKPYVYQFDKGPEAQWIGFKLVGSTSNRDAIGAIMILELEDGEKLKRQVSPHNGYASQSDPRLHFVIPKEKKIKNISVIWPSGNTQPVLNYELRNYHKIEERL